MRVDEVDERDGSWEDHHPWFRVYLFQGGDVPGHSWSVETYDVQDADVREAIDWAETQAGDDRLFAVALVGRQSEDVDPVGARRGLTWLLGLDANAAPHDDTEERAWRGMLTRRGRGTRSAESRRET